MRLSPHRWSEQFLCRFIRDHDQLRATQNTRRFHPSSARRTGDPLCHFVFFCHPGRSSAASSCAPNFGVPRYAAEESLFDVSNGSALLQETTGVAPLLPTSPFFPLPIPVALPQTALLPQLRPQSVYDTVSHRP
jgi:hypothetical protein